MTESTLSLKARLLNIREFSDFTLVCHGREFELHKAIVCSQSSVMANALRAGSQEATTGVLHLPFDIESVKHLIEFMYTGDYQLSPDPALELLSSSISKDSPRTENGLMSASKQATESSKLDSSNGTSEGAIPTSVADRLTCHTRMDSVASYYDIPALSALARAKVDDILVNEWSADAFCGLIQESLDSTSDQKYYQMLAAKAVDHADELAGRHIFETGGVAERLAPYMLPILMESLKATETRGRELISILSLEKSKLEEEDQKSANRSKALDACVQLLNANTRCRNCGIDFACLPNSGIMVNFAARGANLLRSGEWSDFTLVCQDQVFRVHKNIVCQESHVLAAALWDQKVDIGAFKEFWTVRIDEEFDPSTLQRMLDFMYTGTYQDTPFKSDRPPQSPLSRYIQLNQRAQPSQPTQVVFTPAWGPEADLVLIEQGKKKGEERKERAIRTVSEALVYHTRVNRIAARYGVVELASLSAQRVGSLLTENWSSRAFCDLMEEIKGSKLDKSLRQVIVHTASKRIFDLIKTNVFSGGKMEPDLVDDISAASNNALHDAWVRIGVLRDQISEKKKESAELFASLNWIYTTFRHKLPGIPTFAQALDYATKRPQPEAQKSEPAGKQPERVVQESVQVAKPEAQESRSADKQPERAVQEPKPADQQPELEAKESKPPVWGFRAVHPGSSPAPLPPMVLEELQRWAELFEGNLREWDEMPGFEGLPGLEEMSDLEDMPELEGLPDPESNIAAQPPKPTVQESEPEAEGSKSAGKQPERGAQPPALSLRRCHCIRCDAPNPCGVKKVGFALSK
ncbi:hypothetical protein GGR51DRAFT_556389 [Nemania sp. FL0031]|nr:hypothetical protein GGR51DRAFT_556389 [Nemania sp. FL0031]